MNKRRYPKILFIIGFIANIIFHFFWLFMPSMIFLIIGIFSRPFTYLGLGLFGLDFVLSFIEQYRIRRSFLETSDHPDFQAFQQALSNEGNWLKNLHDLMNQSVQSDETGTEDENESKPEVEKETI
ncbi:hypothetical protein [Paracholeplasma manati]|uniref:2TM domain-containing protein n=1 Tax=Paracholeplasma manati TaxID=591373 RepID=A0ABT2YBU1_9MOLU|nr:hypothetical protein [Paracholeplasma manati]MCV2232848.1 hypothetical protein [Paracholeplasma manati]